MHELNEEISDKEIRLIGSEGEQLGIMPPAEALKIADEQGLDLVKISPQANPPVCKLMNYGKFRLEQAGKRGPKEPARGGNQRDPYVSGH